LWSCSQEACRTAKATTNVRSFSTPVLCHFNFHTGLLLRIFGLLPRRVAVSALIAARNLAIAVDGSLHVLHGRTGTVRDRAVA
jgi:hypothetical protein